MARSLRLQALNRHLSAATEPVPPTPDDPYPDPGDYRGKALAYITKPSAAESEGSSSSDGAAGSAAAGPVLTAEDHAHFLRTGFIHLRGVIPPDSVAQTLEHLDQPKPDCTRLHAAVRELLGPKYSMEMSPTSGGYDMSRPLVTPEADPEEFATALAGSYSDTVVTSGRAHCDDGKSTICTPTALASCFCAVGLF